MTMDLKREADQLEAAAHALEQSLRPQLDAVTFMRDAARRLKQAARRGSVEETTPPLPAAHEGGPRA